MNIKNKTFKLTHSPGATLITGGAKRIGLEITKILAEEKYPVAIHYKKSKKEAELLAKKIRDQNKTQVITIYANLTIEEDIQKAFKKVKKELGPITCLINNASSFVLDDINTSNRKLWDRHLQTNLRAPFLLCQLMAKMLPKNLQGNIINIIDERVLNLTPYFLSYTISKSALWTMTQTLALALAPNIRVNAVGPGPALPSDRQTSTQFKEQCLRMPLKRGTTPKEIAETVKFLLCMPAITGQLINLDGGQHLGWAQPSSCEQKDD
tara:strand:- start:233 stop:1030 length:798 start_codon:yes stop_codon:yes gene_type:complete